MIRVVRCAKILGLAISNYLSGMNTFNKFRKRSKKIVLDCLTQLKRANVDSTLHVLDQLQNIRAHHFITA